MPPTQALPLHLEMPIARLTNQALGELHQAGYGIYAIHAQMPSVLIFQRATPQPRENSHDSEARAEQEVPLLHSSVQQRD